MQDIRTATSRPLSTKSIVPQRTATPDDDSGNRDLRGTSKEEPIRSPGAEARRQQSRMSGRSERSRRVSLATVRESSTHSQQCRQRLSGPGGMQSDQQGWRPPSNYGRPPSDHLSGESTENEGYLGGLLVVGEYRKKGLPGGAAGGTDTPGRAF